MQTPRLCCAARKLNVWSRKKRESSAKARWDSNKFAKGFSTPLRRTQNQSSSEQFALFSRGDHNNLPMTEAFKAEKPQPDLSVLAVVHLQTLLGDDVNDQCGSIN